MGHGNFKYSCLTFITELSVLVGTEEKIENGVRCVYEKKWQSSGGGDGTVTYLKYEYGSEKVLEKTVIEVKKGKIKYIEGKLRTERK